MDVNPLSDMSLVNMFSHSVGCPFTLLMISFAVQKLFSLMYPIYLFFLLFPLPGEIYQIKKIAMSNVQDFTASAFFYDFYGFGSNI